MNQEYVSKSACKGCEHLEHVEGALLSEYEYACKAGPLECATSRLLLSGQEKSY